MTPRLRVAVTCIALELILLSPRAIAQSMITVYFVPLEIETYVPITPATISAVAWEKWTIFSKPKMSRLVHLLSQGSAGAFDEGRVRVMIVAGTRTYLIDASGIVLQGKSGVKIDRSELERFRRSLNADERKILRTQSRNPTEGYGPDRQ